MIHPHLRSPYALRRFWLFVFAVSLGSWTGTGQENEWAWKECRNWLAAIDRGEIQNVVPELEAYLEQNPTHGESLFTLAVVEAGRNRPERAVQAMERALASGVPAGRFLAGPRPWFESIRNSEAYRSFWERRPESFLIHGPMLGDVTDRSARVWVRTAREAEVQIQWRVKADRAAEYVHSQAKSALSRDDRTAIVEINDLEPSTHYEYRLLLGQRVASPVYTFKTAPDSRSGSAFKIAFGGGAAYQPKFERMWRVIAARKPQAMLLLGDNVYIDHPEQPNVQRYCYYRRHSQPDFRALIAGIPVYSIWDDHDFIDDDGWGGPLIGEPEWKNHVWKIFQENWNNPEYGGGESRPGCYYRFRIGQVDFIMLDGRYYREDPRNESPSMLGPEQLAWLKETLAESDGVFKALCSPVPWARGVKPGSRDPWDGYAEERESIFQWIRENRIGGVVLVSADRHRSDLWKLEEAAGYDLYEFESSRLTNLHKHGPVPGVLFSYNEKCSFGLLEFDTGLENPTVTYRVVNIDDEEVFSFELQRSRLESQEFRMLDVLSGLSSDDPEEAGNAEEQLLENSDLALRLLVENYLNPKTFDPESHEIDPAIIKAFKLLGERAVNIVPGLIQAMDSNNRLLASRAIRSIGAIGPAAGMATTDLIRRFSDPFWPVKLSIAECLVSINSNHFRLKELLLNGMKSNDSHVKIGCSFTLLLMDTDNPKALEALISSLTVNDNDLRTNAIMACYHLTAKHNKTSEALDKITPALIVNLDDEVTVNKKFASIALGNIGLRAADEIKSELRGKNLNRVYYAMMAIEAMRPDLSLFTSELEELADSSNKRIRDQARKLLNRRQLHAWPTRY